jgi:uncharacterized protein YndB with AHSA1/START domain
MRNQRLHISRRLKVIQNVIEKDILIDAPLQVVWETVTDPSHISRWFSDKAEVELRPEGKGSMTWNDHNFTVEFHVEKVEAPNLFSYRWCYPEDEEPSAKNSTLVEFILTSEDEKTRLRVVESGMLEADWTDEKKSDHVNGHIDGWGRHIGDLGTYIAGDRQTSARP